MLFGAVVPDRCPLSPSDAQCIFDSSFCACVVSCFKDILSTYVAVGIYEEWSLSMQLFDAKVPTSVRKWDSGMKLNNGPHSPERETLLQWAYESPDILQVLAADLMLYDVASSLFRDQVHAALGNEAF